MRSLSTYILRQIVGPFLLFLLLMTVVVWLTQSLRLLELVINRSQSAAMFAYLTLLMLPTLLTVIIPIAFFAGTLYALHRLNNDSELVVMWAAGFGRWQLASPVLLAAGFAMGMTYLCNLYLMPLGERTMQAAVFDIRADIGAAILHEGSFTTPATGLTVFIREINSDGEIRGILVHDNRDPERPLTYLAEKGVFALTSEGARLVMRAGHIEQAEQGGARLSVLKFDSYVFNLEQFESPQREASLDVHERYLSELFNPQFKNAKQARKSGTYLAEAHNRLSSPLYSITFALMALAAAANGATARGGYALRLIAVSLAAAAVRVAGYGAQALAARNPMLNAVMYLLPIGAGALAVADLMGAPIFRLPRRSHAVPAEQVP
ncbi:MAG: LPS export ABC transporter permease LptF [Alphaproteobacteria bacterium]